MLAGGVDAFGTGFQNSVGDGGPALAVAGDRARLDEFIRQGEWDVQGRAIRQRTYTVAISADAGDARFGRRRGSGPGGAAFGLAVLALFHDRTV